MTPDTFSLRFWRNLAHNPSRACWSRIWSQFCDICLRSGATAPQSWPWSRKFTSVRPFVWAKHKNGSNFWRRTDINLKLAQKLVSSNFPQKIFFDQVPPPPRTKVVENFTGFRTNPYIGDLRRLWKIFIFPILSARHLGFFRNVVKIHNKSRFKRSITRELGITAQNSLYGWRGNIL